MHIVNEKFRTTIYGISTPPESWRAICNDFNKAAGAMFTLCQGADDGLVILRPAPDQFADLLDADPPLDAFAALRAAEATGRPLGTPSSSPIWSAG